MLQPGGKNLSLLRLHAARVWLESLVLTKTFMKYRLSWNERRKGSPMEQDNAQKRMLQGFTRWYW